MSAGYVVVSKDVNGEILHFYIHWGSNSSEAIEHAKKRSGCNDASVIKELDLKLLETWKTAVDLLDGITFSEGRTIEVTTWANTKY